MNFRDIRIEDFTYPLPSERIAAYPLARRDASKLLIFRNGILSEDVSRNMADFIPSESLMVFNDTRVIRARLLFRKETGGTIEVFCLEPDELSGSLETAMQQQGKVRWKCMIGGASKWKNGLILHSSFPAESLTVSAAIVKQNTGSFTVEFSWDRPELTFGEVLQIAGEVPLPPYLHRAAEEEDAIRYQTIYAKHEGSVAAPTAGLHFTPDVLKRIGNKGIEIGFVTLHVGAGTFKPVKTGKMTDHEMHAEWIEADVDFIRQLICSLEEKKTIVAVGTTSLRTLESLYWIGAQLLQGQLPDFDGIAVPQWMPYQFSNQDVPAPHALQAIVDWLLQIHQQKLITRTQLLIAPGYRFRIVEALVTNFHQPKSTLLLLVAAFVGEDWKKVYQYALNNDFRFLSYGDGSLLWRKDDALEM